MKIGRDTEEIRNRVRTMCEKGGEDDEEISDCYIRRFG